MTMHVFNQFVQGGVDLYQLQVEEEETKKTRERHVVLSQ
jgi:hypothetical protein